mmetsp:Transcript_113721/g.226314  ORF Transcript_113721/g.226314 Transcript_113721/m.226314 type:complete len:523 (+) Transcript_113721:43-1611(+)
MPLQSFFCVVSLTLAVASAREDCVATAAKTCAENGDRVAASATNSIIQGRVDVLAGVELKVHPDSDVAKKGRGEWIILPDGGCRQGDLEALAANMPNNTRALIHGHPDSGGLCFFVMEGTREGVWQKLAMHRWSSTPKVETDTAVHFDAQVARESDQLRTVGGLENWGLDRIDQRNDNLDDVFEPMSKTGGSGVDVYVMDTGIRTSHTEFGGRAVPKLETFEGESKECKNTDEDCAEDAQGHGTYCAAIVGGKNAGVAPQATLHAVKVHDGTNGTAKSLYLAFDWLLSQDLPVASTVFSMSLNLGDVVIFPPSLRSALTETYDRGITTVLASGNHGSSFGGWVLHDKTAAAIQVGAVGKKDKEWESNGKRYDILAPGVGVQSAWITEEESVWDNKKPGFVLQVVPSDTGKKTFDGTSAAAPHVAGAAALLLSEAKSRDEAFSPAAVKKTLMKHGSDFCKGKIACHDKRVMLYIGRQDKYNYEINWMQEAEWARPGATKRSGSNTLPPWGTYEADKDVHLVLR